MTVTRVAWSAWDGVLFVLWLAQVGVFGSAYTSSVQVEYANATLSITRMRAAVWLDLISMVLWFITTILGIAWCIRTRKFTRRVDQPDTSQGELGVLLGKQGYASGKENSALVQEKGIFQGPPPPYEEKNADAKVQPQ